MNLKIILFLIIVILNSNLVGQVIIKRVKNAVLLNVGKDILKKGEELIVYKAIGNKVIETGKIQISGFRENKAYGRIINEKSDKISVGDVVCLDWWYKSFGLKSSKDDEDILQKEKKGSYKYGPIFPKGISGVGIISEMSFIRYYQTNTIGLLYYTSYGLNIGIGYSVNLIPHVESGFIQLGNMGKRLNDRQNLDFEFTFTAIQIKNDYGLAFNFRPFSNLEFNNALRFVLGLNMGYSFFVSRGSYPSNLTFTPTMEAIIFFNNAFYLLVGAGIGIPVNTDNDLYYTSVYTGLGIPFNKI